MFIRVNDLKECLNKVMPAVVNDKQLPITSLVGINLYKGESKSESLLEITAYDGINVVRTYKM